jgi:hypothetical protein
VWTGTLVYYEQTVRWQLRRGLVWRRALTIGDPVEINPSIGAGLKIMTVDEWSSRWGRNDKFPDCLACGSTSTKVGPTQSCSPNHG